MRAMCRRNNSLQTAHTREHSPHIIMFLSLGPARWLAFVFTHPIAAKTFEGNISFSLENFGGPRGVRDVLTGTACTTLNDLYASAPQLHKIPCQKPA